MEAETQKQQALTNANGAETKKDLAEFYGFYGKFKVKSNTQANNNMDKFEKIIK